MKVNSYLKHPTQRIPTSLLNTTSTYGAVKDVTSKRLIHFQWYTVTLTPCFHSTRRIRNTILPVYTKTNPEPCVIPLKDNWRL